MDVSENEMIQTLIKLTGLPEHLAYEELTHILEFVGLKPDEENMTLDKLRAAMLVYLESLEQCPSKDTSVL
jgi:hypothetical protein